MQCKQLYRIPALSCPPLAVSNHSSLSSEDRTVGSLVTSTCKQGYHRPGLQNSSDEVLACLPTQSWNSWTEDCRRNWISSLFYLQSVEYQQVIVLEAKAKIRVYALKFLFCGNSNVTYKYFSYIRLLGLSSFFLLAFSFSGTSPLTP